MRTSCNGCRVLRKACSDGCTIRPCLQWIKTPQSQANATLFLAKFYGRAGLLNLINAGPDHVRPAIFRSLLYEACGRIVNPVYGSAGLLWSRSWQLCQAAVEAVLSGEPIAQVSTDSPPLKACDIRHVSRDEDSTASTPPEIRPSKSRKRSTVADSKPESSRLKSDSRPRRNPPPSRQGGDSDSASGETTEVSSAKSDDDNPADGSDMELELELTLGFEPAGKARKLCPPIDGVSEATWMMDVGPNLSS